MAQQIQSMTLRIGTVNIAANETANDVINGTEGAENGTVSVIANHMNNQKLIAIRS